ncbi:ShlB/FhaC/HecB family hemolysin secretion/activation protein, partial [Telmatospirillum siberiense]
AVKADAPSLTEGTVPDFNAVSRDIVALNQLPDRKVTPSLRAGTTPGTVDVDLTVEDKLPLHGSLELNDRYSANTTRLRLNGTLHYDNLWQLGHSLSVSYQIAPENPKDAKVFSGSYLARVPGWSEVSFLLYGVNQDSNVNSLGSMDVAGRGQVIGTRAVITLPGEEGFFHTLSTGPDYKNFHEAVSTGGSGYETPITYWPVTTTWSGTWQGEGTLTQANAGVTFGFRGLGSGPGAFDNKRYKSGGDFIYFRGDVSRTQDLPEGLQLFGKVQGQAANAALISNEEYSAGGLDSVRGYLESEVLGDSAALASVELRSPSLSRWLGDAVINEWRLYTFAEGGHLAVHDALAEEHSAFDLASIGVGTRGKFWDYLNGSADFAVPLLGQSSTKRYDPRLTFRLWSEF